MIYHILETQIVLPDIKKVPKAVLVRYSDFINMFLKNLTMELAKPLNINKYNISSKKISNYFIG